MWKLLVTLCVLAVSTTSIDADAESCHMLHEIRAFKGEEEPYVSLKIHAQFMEFEKTCTIPSNTIEAADFTRVDVVSSSRECKMIEVTSELFQKLSDLKDLKLDCVSFTPTSTSSNTQKSLRKLELSRTEWSISAKEFLTNYSPNLLMITNINIPVLYPHTFPENSVNSLVMRSNNLRQISDNSFVQFRSLKSLRIFNNKISHLGPLMFSGLEKLTDLNLGENEIATIEPNTFSGMPMLDSLVLSRNKLTIVPVEAFKSLHNLQSLILGYNNINNMEADHLAGLRLTNLSVQMPCNNMTCTQKSTLRGLHLKALDVSSCNYSNIRGEPCPTESENKPDRERKTEPENKTDGARKTEDGAISTGGTKESPSILEDLADLYYTVKMMTISGCYDGNSESFFCKLLGF